MEKKLKKVLVFALPALVLLGICAVFWEFATRFILVMSFLTSLLAAGVAFLDTYQGDAATAATSYTVCKYAAAIAATTMFGSFGLSMVGIMGSEFMMSLVTGLVPLFGPVFGARLGIFLKNRKTT